ncbi:MAG: hypothetical protein KR126chlam4_01128 [Candidatus Anoxychlamydiales bacterium]|nr:hypothetical protein [Candidatus Anoxychlamydiales bacterium]
MGNYSKDQAIERVGETPASDEKRRIERWQAFYYPPIEKSADVTYSLNPSFQVKKATLTSIEKTPSNDTNLFPTKSAEKSILPKLEPKSKEPYKTQKNRALGYEIAQAIGRNETILQDISETLINNISLQNQAILKLSKEDEEHLNELLKELSKKENVDIVKSLLNITVASTAIVVGALIIPEALATTGVVAAGYGVILIGSGITNLIANELLPRIGGYEKIASFFTKDETKKQNLADNIQTATSITSTILSVASAIASGPIIGSVLGWAEGLKIVNTATNLATATTSFVKHKNDYTYKNLQSEQTNIDGKLNLERFKLDKDYASLQSAADVEVAFNKISFNIFQTLQKMAENNLN